MIGMRTRGRGTGWGFGGGATAGGLALALLAAPAAAQLNDTQVSMGAAIRDDCPESGNKPAFQSRCNSVVGASVDMMAAAVLASLQEVSPEQINSQGTQTTRTDSGEVASVGAGIANRLGLLRAGSIARFQIELNGNEVYANELSELGPGGVTRGAAGADAGTPGRLGVYLHGSYQFGTVDSTFDAVGFDYDNGGITAGADYRVLDDLILGGAFTWWHTDSQFNGDGGETTSNLYNGSIYGSYYPIWGLYLTALASSGGLDYETERRIQYTITPSMSQSGDKVNATATGSPSAKQWSVHGGLGYDFDLGPATLGSYAQVNYRRLSIDGYSESGGSGWAMRFEDQRIGSLTTALGGQISYSISTPVGVITPQLRSAWWHEFEDNSRRVRARFLGAGSPEPFVVFTSSPDRNFGNVGASVSMTLPRGIAAFVDYDALVAYDDISSNRFTFGVRAAFF